MSSATVTTSAEDRPAGVSRRRRLPPRAEKLAVPVFIVAVAVLPFFFANGSAFIGDCVLALAYTVMALGLNIIVGFAGLLDLGYVAFFAIGAYTMGWFGSGFLSKVGGG